MAAACPYNASPRRGFTAVIPDPAHAHAHPAGTPGDLPAPRRAATGKVFIETHGCQMNEYDSAKMADVLAEHEGLELTDNVAEADVILVNTCSIREKAQERCSASWALAPARRRTASRS